MRKLAIALLLVGCAEEIASSVHAGSIDVPFSGEGTAADPWASSDYFHFAASSGNWATPGWVSPIKIGTADLHDDDGVPYLVNWGWIAKSMDMGFRLETPNGTTVGGLIGFSTAPEMLYIFAESYSRSFASPMPNGPPTNTTAHPAVNYGTFYRIDADQALAVQVRDDAGTHTASFPYGAQRIVARGVYAPSGWGNVDVVTTLTRRPGEFFRTDIWPINASSEFDDVGLIYFSGAAVTTWFRRTSTTDQVELLMRANASSPGGSVEWIVYGFLPPE